jgi:hypothetical protein
MKLLEQYTTDEMLDAFTKLYNEAKRQFEYLQKHGHEEEDAGHHLWESVIELLGPDIWKEWNQYYEDE